MSFLPLHTFAPFGRVPRDWMMLVLKSFFDESGKEDDPNLSACSVAGYVTEVGVWEAFERRWRGALDLFEVPYFHMKEFGAPNGPYAKWREGRDGEREDFLKALISVIEGCALTGIGSLVRLTDLRRFNREFGTRLDAYALCIYGCFLELREMFPHAQMQMVVDGFPGVSSKIEAARQYAASDGYYREIGPYVAKQLTVTPLAEGITFRCVLPIQAADFAAWEIRKSSERKNEWFEFIRPAVPPENRQSSMLNWTILDGVKKRGKFDIPGDLERKSLQALQKAARIDGPYWDYDILVAAHKARGGAWGGAPRKKRSRGKLS
ncbi:MAG TPA: hypothetical protein VMU06_11595 [Stellaceae bacterium]|nr:hypothetical protein [Stellaceae bacterium]